MKTETYPKSILITNEAPAQYLVLRGRTLVPRLGFGKWQIAMSNMEKQALIRVLHSLWPRCAWTGGVRRVLVPAQSSDTQMKQQSQMTQQKQVKKAAGLRGSQGVSISTKPDGGERK